MYWSLLNYSLYNVIAEVIFNMSSIGINKRFIDENLVTGKSLNSSGFGTGASGREKAVEAAIKKSGSD